MITVVAVQNFDHGGNKKRGDVFEVSDIIANRLKSRGLVRFDVDPVSHPDQAVGTRQSALPAAEALPQTIAKKSGNGESKKKGAASFAPIPPSD